MKPNRLTPTDLIAGILVLVAVAAVAAWVWTEGADEWMVNTATSALFAALAVTVVDRAVRRERRERYRPWRDRVFGDLRLDFSLFASGLVTDYAGTHLYSFRPIRRDVTEFFDQWLDEYTSRDACAFLISDESGKIEPPLVISLAADLGKNLQSIREHDREVLEPELVAALDSVLWKLSMGVRFYRFSRSNWIGDLAVSQANAAERTIVEAARDLGKALVRHDTLARMEFDDLTLEAASAHNKNMVRVWDQRIEMYRDW